MKFNTTRDAVFTWVVLTAIMGYLLHRIEGTSLWFSILYIGWLFCGLIGFWWAADNRNTNRWRWDVLVLSILVFGSFVILNMYAGFSYWATRF